jgi:hypothetical protein
MTTATKTTLADFGPASIWYTSVGRPTGETIDMTEVDDPRDAENMVPFEWDIEGTIDEDGEWAWDGKGNPTDFGNNTIYAIRAFKS